MSGVDNSDNSVDKSDKDGREDRKPAEKPVSLAPLKFEEAVSDLLKVSTKPRASAIKRRRKTSGVET